MKTKKTNYDFFVSLGKEIGDLDVRQGRDAKDSDVVAEIANWIAIERFKALPTKQRERAYSKLFEGYMEAWR
mgnify:CR=1 FL=1